MTLVVDASVAVEYLLRTALGRRVAPTLEQARLVSPELLDAEVLAVLRRETLAGRLHSARADEAVEDLARWPLERMPHRGLIATAWSLRGRVTAYDAMYVAAAIDQSAPLVTADGPLARAPSLGVVVHNLRAP